MHGVTCNPTNNLKSSESVIQRTDYRFPHHLKVHGSYETFCSQNGVKWRSNYIRTHLASRRTEKAQTLTQFKGVAAWRWGAGRCFPGRELIAASLTAAACPQLQNLKSTPSEKLRTSFQGSFVTSANPESHPAPLLLTSHTRSSPHSCCSHTLNRQPLQPGAEFHGLYASLQRPEWGDKYLLQQRAAFLRLWALLTFGFCLCCVCFL